MKERNINADELSAYLKSTGKTFSLAMERHGVVEGNRPDHSQPCPYCGGNNRFWYSANYDCFFCRKCPAPSGQKQRRISIYDLESHHFSIDNFPEVLVGIPSGHDMEQTLPFDSVTTARDFSVDGNMFGGSYLEIFDDESISVFERIRIEEFEDSLKGVV